jgi:hypothetical protein
MEVNDCAEFDSMIARIADEKGVALIIVLVMLLLLSILGITMLASTTSDLQIAGNYRNNQEAFYTGEAVMQFGETFGDIYTQIIPNVLNSWPPPGQGTVLTASYWPSSTPNSAQPDYNHIQIPNTNDSADVKVELQGSGPLPAGSGTQEDAGSGGTAFKANYYAVSVIAYGPNNATGQYESSIARVIPNN